MKKTQKNILFALTLPLLVASGPLLSFFNERRQRTYNGTYLLLAQLVYLLLGILFTWAAVSAFKGVRTPFIRWYSLCAGIVALVAFYQLLPFNLPGFIAPFYFFTVSNFSYGTVALVTGYYLTVFACSLKK